ncbi:MAG: hypothetical protein U1E49_02310 [Hyphomicrobiaceae bacterium]
MALPIGPAEAEAVSVGAAPARSIEQAARADVVKVAKKRKRRARSKDQSEPETPDVALVAAPGETLVTGSTAAALIKPLTPAASYRAGQSVFFEVVVAKRKGARSRSVRLELMGTALTSVVTASKGVTVKTADAQTSVELPLGSGRQTFMLEVRIAAALPAATLASALDIRLRDKKDAAVDGEGKVSFAIADCATAYHRALGTLYASRETAYADALKRASQPDETLSGEWLFVPRKRAKREVEAAANIQLPPRAECRWSVSTVDFSTRQSKRQCKRWEIVEIGAPMTGQAMPVIDEAEAADVLARAGRFVASRGAASDFGKNGKLEWVSRRILTDLRTYMQQSPHPAICTGVDVMTEYFLDNAVSLRKEIDASSKAFEAARRLASLRLEALAMVLGRAPEEPAETASLALITPAHAGQVDGAAVGDLVSETGRLLLSDPQRLSLEAVSGSAGKLALLHSLFAEPSRPPIAEDARPYVADALSALEAAVTLETADARYEGIGTAIFGSIADIEKAHGASCGCAE